MNINDIPKVTPEMKQMAELNPMGTGKIYAAAIVRLAKLEMANEDKSVVE